MNSEDVFLQATLVFGSVRAIRAAFRWIFAALDPQMVLHVPQPTVTFVASRASEATRFPIQAAARSRWYLEARTIGRERQFPLPDRSILTTICRPGAVWKKKVRNNVLSLGRFFVNERKFLGDYREAINWI